MEKLILQRKETVNLPELQEKYGHLIEGVGFGGTVEVFLDLAEMQQIYNAGMSEISTKLEILDDEFQIRHKHNPIHHMECRLKTPRSIMEKLRRYGQPADMATARKTLQDIAGIRVICNYIEDVYAVEEMLLKQSDIHLLRRKDYIASPKPNGYRSLHIIVDVPVFLSDRTEVIPVEIQLRTIAMDYWASLEHQLRYKNDSGELEEYAARLEECAGRLAEIEEEMQRIHHDIR